jgi:hypothetical protein
MTRALVLSFCLFTLAATPIPAVSDINSEEQSFFTDFDARGSLQFAKFGKHRCGRYGKANNCKAQWFKQSAECRCLG